MDHLHNNNIIHRDLACRNVLVEVKRAGHDSFVLVPKISDFGLSVATSKQTRLPVRWTAPEVLRNPKMRNPEADVWSFGVVMYEVFTRCQEIPYLGKKNQEVVSFVLGGGKLDPGVHVDSTIAEIMMDCFKMRQEWRPNFKLLSVRLTDVLKDMSVGGSLTNSTFTTVDNLIDSSSLQVFADGDEEKEYMLLRTQNSAMTTSHGGRSGAPLLNSSYEVIKSTDYESIKT